MPARHYNLEYNVNGGPWLPGKTDETPGPDKSLTVAGLSTGTYAVKLRMVPLTGDTTPIVSNETIMQVGTPGISEPVQTFAAAEVTVAELITRRDTLLAAAGVTVSAADAQVMNEALLSSATEAGSVVTGFAETVTAAGEVVATVTDVQTMLEQVVAAISAAATVSDTYTPAAAAPAAPATSVTAGDGQNTVTWGAVSGATSYNIYWTSDGSTPTLSSTKITGATSPYVHSGRTNGVTYKYAATAVNAVGESALSEVKTGVPYTGFTDSFTGANGDPLSSTYWNTLTTEGSLAGGSYFNIQNSALATHLSSANASLVRQVYKAKTTLPMAVGRYVEFKQTVQKPLTSNASLLVFMLFNVADHNPSASGRPQKNIIYFNINSFASSRTMDLSSVDASGNGTSLGSIVVTDDPAGTIYRMEITSSSQVRVLRNGIQLIAPVSFTATLGTDLGFVAQSLTNQTGGSFFDYSVDDVKFL